MRFLKRALPHVALALLLGLPVLAILDAHNPLMAFLTSTSSKVYLLTACAVSVIAIILLLAENTHRN